MWNDRTLGVSINRVKVNNCRVIDRSIFLLTFHFKSMKGAMRNTILMAMLRLVFVLTNVFLTIMLLALILNSLM